MATPRRRFTRSPAAPDVRLSLGVVFEGPRPGRADAEADRLWLALRREVDAAAEGGPFDPRHVLTMTAAALAAWRARRYAWAADCFRRDRRVEV